MTQYFADVTTIPGIVREIVALPDGAEPAECLSADFLARLVSCPSTAQQGWTYRAGVFAAPVETLADAQSAAAAAADAYLGALMAAGFTYDGKLYQIDPASQANIAAMGSLAQSVVAATSGAPSWPAGFGWIAADNSLVAMTAAQMFGFAATVAGYVSACILNCRTIKTALAAAATVEAVAAIDVSAGYPAAHT